MNEEERITTSIARWFYLLVFMLGIAFYFSWSAMYNAWTDLGVYAITVILVFSGLFGTLLYWKKNEN